MIGFLRGSIADKQLNKLIVDVQGVGYEVHVPLSTFYDAGEAGADITLRIYTHVREDALQLYGFLTELERQLFERLIGISGIGDGRSVAFLLAFIAVVGFVSTPLQSAASREVEARADLHALDLTGDPSTFVAMQRRLALTAKADVTPNAVVYRLFGSHPKTTARLAAARAWAEEHWVSLSGPVVPVEEGV